MGVGPFSISSCNCDNCGNSPLPPVQVPNPNPKYFQIQAAEQHGYFIAVWVFYPGCTNYEGNKILVFELPSVKNKNVLAPRELDPHFCENDKNKVLVARFVPTHKGWKLATKLVRDLNHGDIL